MDADHAFAAGKRSGDVQTALVVEGHALRAAEAAIEHVHLAVAGDAVDAVVARSGGAGDVEVAVGTEGQVVGRHGLLQGGEDEDLAVGTDLEDGSGTVADVEVLLAVEGHAGGDAHAFHEYGHIARGRDLVDHAVVAAADVKHAGGVKGEARGIHQFVDERLGVQVEIDLIDGHGHLLAARPAEGGVNIAEGIDGRVGDRVEAFGDQDTDIAGPGFTGMRAVFDHEAAGEGAFGHSGDDEGIGTDDDGGSHIADRDARAAGLGKPLAADLQFATRDGRSRADLSDQGTGFGLFPQWHPQSQYRANRGQLSNSKGGNW